MVADRPQILFRSHPMDAVEAGEVNGPGVFAEGLLARQIKVVLEAGHNELTRSAVYGLAESQTGIVGFRYRSPMSVLPENREHVVVVADRRKILSSPV